MNDLNQTVDEPGREPPPADSAVPQHIGRYRIERVLGRGGFGLVYLAHDEQLQRLVAIKVPHPERVERPEDAEAYLTEARTVASLDHPHIVPVYDVGSTPSCPCFVVSKYIDGTNLAIRLGQSPLSLHESVELVATVAEALHQAHRQGLVHRDIKPGNILLDRGSKPFVADFGLALREQDLGQGPRYAGTPAYMSPEQARGEGHRVDGRSDVFSLGVVFYELLTGRRPFRADAQAELLDQITSVEARPPRQIDDTIPREVDRICLKALSKRASERYSAARDMADDLRHFLSKAAVEEKSVLTGRGKPETDVATQVPTPATPPASDSQPVKIVPRGLRSFDAADADFFLELLPGPRDRDGLPDSIRFWKTRIESTDADGTFSVGLIYGPSGCGKSSLVKAGLLPRLARSVRVVYIEATGEETEVRLLRGLRRYLPDLPANLSLGESLAGLRRGRYLEAGQKVLLVLDQFEQWLHARGTEENTELVQALRQCDGGRLQAVVLVRDDFWMAATRFMRDLEISLIQGQNSAAVDLFTLRHAQKVLAAFGRAFGALPETGHGRPADPSLVALARRLEPLSDEYRELREGVEKAIHVADVDPEMALTRARKVLEYVIRDVYERRIKEPPGTRPLENLLQRIVKDGHFPERLDAYANTIRKLGNVGTHSFGEQVLATDVWQSLTQLLPILEWYLEVERPEAVTSNRPIRTRPLRLAGAAPAPSEQQQAFLEQALSGLAQDGKVICVRLALFAEMVKGKPWTPATLREVGGTEGVGVTFLEETFSGAGAPPEHRYHQKAARAVLKALLPESGTDIKGHMRSRQELLEVSGYASRPRDFADLLRILDGEIRLITPTDPEGKEDADTSTLPASAKYYQLTHDYLVPSLRSWLTRKQKETRKGRAELLLADRAAVWNARPESRQLPSLLQWLQIRWHTRKKSWTPPERKMMGEARRYHALRGFAVLVVLALLGWGGYEAHGTLKAHGLRDRLLDANTAEVPTVVQDMAPYRRWGDHLLRDALREAEAGHDARKQLHASLALLPVDATQVDYIYGRLLDAQPQEVLVLRDALAPHQDALRDRLWAVLEKPEKGKEGHLLRAAAALASYDRDSERWAKVGPRVVNDLVRENPVHLLYWSEAFRPVKGFFLDPLSVIFRERSPERAAERLLATNLLADHAADNPTVLADLLMDADEKQFAVLYPGLRDQGDRALPLLTAEIDARLPADLSSSDPKREALAKRQANAAVVLLRLNQPAKVWPLLQHSPDPRVRSYLIHRLSPLGAGAGAILQRLNEEPDLTIRRALLLSLGEYDEEELPAASRPAALARVQALYRAEHDPGLHAAAEWLLRQWDQEAWLSQVNEDWAKDREGREKQLEKIQELVRKDRERTPPQWYVNGQGQTMVVIPGPMEFLMGAPVTEEGRDEDETQHRRRIGRSFALAAKAVTVAEYRRFDRAYTFTERFAPEPECPVVNTSWYQAAVYCNWLSKEEGIGEEQWCYETDETGRVTKLKENYLSLTGYRLPTEAEVEHAARAGAVTSRYYGETEELLERYGWYLKNSKERSWPMGRKKPNDLGLFDLHGNVYTWCQEEKKGYPPSEDGESFEDKEDDLSVQFTSNRVMRGGSFVDQAPDVRCAFRSGLVPSLRVNYVGFRPARTFPP